MGNVIDTFSMAKLEALAGWQAAMDAVPFMPNLTIVRGTILGQVSAASANEVQTINYSDTWAAGDTMTLAITGIDGGTYSTTLTMNSTPAFTNAAVKTAIEALLVAAGYSGVTVTIGGGPGATDQTITFGGSAAYWDMPLMTATYVTAGDGTVVVDATTAGQRLGVWGPYVGTKLANPAAGPTATSAATGSLPLLGQFIVTYTHLNAQGESLPSPGTAVALTTTNQSIDVTPGTLPAGTTGVNIYLNGIFAETSAQTTATLVNVGQVATSAIPHPAVNTAFTNADGRHKARAIAAYDFRTDNMGRVVYAGASQSPQHSAYDQSAPVYFAGAFKTTDLTGLDAAAVTDMGKIIKGSVADGVLVI